MINHRQRNAPSRKSPRSAYFLAKLSVRFCLCTNPPGCGGLCGGAGPPPPSNPFCLDLGFNGDNAPALEGGPIPDSANPPTPGGPSTFLLPRPPPPVPLPAPNTGGPACEEAGLVRSRSFARSSESGEESAPRFCLLAFSCLAWTERKCWRRSCHLISSLPNFDRVEEMFPTALHSRVSRKHERGAQREPYDDFGAMCRNPEELTALSLFLRETNAEL